MNALHQEENIFLHYQDDKDTILYIEMKPVSSKEDLKFMKFLFRTFIEKNLNKVKV